MADRRGHVLVVDDEPDIRALVGEILGDEGYEVVGAQGAESARELRRARRPDVILLDIWMPGTDGITLLREWSGAGGLDAPVIVMSGHGTIETAVEATRLGAYDFLEKPISLAKLVLTVGRALEADRLIRENLRLRRRTETGTEIIGSSTAMNELRDRAARAAAHDAPILVTGESGTGKSRLARHVHALSPRRDGPFVAVSVAGLTEPEELFGSERDAAIHYGPLERANAGTVFLEDIADMPPGMQASLAGALQNGSFLPYRRPRAGQGGHPDHRRLAARSPGGGGPGRPARGPLLPPERRAARGAAAPGARGGHPRCSSSGSSTSSPPARTCRSAAATWRPRTGCATTPGRATCASCATWCSG